MGKNHYITMGDPAGIGPEIIIKAFCKKDGFPSESSPVVVGDAERLKLAAAVISPQERIQWIKADPGLSYPFKPGVIPLIDLNNVPDKECSWGKISAAGGKASFEYIEKAAHLTKKFGGSLVTAPINKESLKAASVPYIGHTEILGGLFGVENPVTMFQTLGLRVFFLSRHVSLRKACDLVTKERLLPFYKECFKHMKALGINEPSLAVAGLNPHCGEHGLFGNEEVEHVEPSVQEARNAGLNVIGPIGADSVYHQAKIGRYSAVVSLYHDQGHIATKTLDFERTISVTLGMPVLRTSVDHGTAFDIAGTGKASEVSIIEALRVSHEYS